MNPDNKVQTDLKGDIITATEDDYVMLEDGTSIVAWYEIKK